MDWKITLAQDSRAENTSAHAEIIASATHSSADFPNYFTNKSCAYNSSKLHECRVNKVYPPAKYFIHLCGGDGDSPCPKMLDKISHPSHFENFISPLINFSKRVRSSTTQILNRRQGGDGRVEVERERESIKLSVPLSFPYYTFVEIEK